MQRLEILTRQLLSAPHDERKTITEYEGETERKPIIASRAEYEAMWHWSIADPAGFWGSQASTFHWHKNWDENQHVHSNLDVRRGPITTEFFKGGQTNIAYNCLDRWVLSGAGSRPCLIWEGNDVDQQLTMTYQETLAEVCRVSNWLKSEGVQPGDYIQWLKSKGVQPGDTVTLYLAMTPELPIAMLACARIGAVHSVVFAGFSAEGLAQRVSDARSRVVITASGMARGKNKVIAMKTIVDGALKICTASGHAVQAVLVKDDPALPRRSNSPAASPAMVMGRDMWWADEVAVQSDSCEPEWVESEAPLFLLYTSGSTGKPKGVVHTTGGYMVGAAAMCRYVFDVRPADVYFATADCGWITGHTCWQIIDKYKARAFYTAPTLIRSLLQLGDKWVEQHDLSSLRVLGTVGEPIGAHAWHWYHDVVGKGRCPVVDTWWQTETGSVMMTPFPAQWSHMAPKPGSAKLPFFGVRPALMGPDGKEVQGAMPSMARTLFKDTARFESTYFEPYPGDYFTGDGCRRDEQGDYWITGRVDDVTTIHYITKTNHIAENHAPVDQGELLELRGVVDDSSNPHHTSITTSGHLTMGPPNTPLDHGDYLDYRGRVDDVTAHHTTNHTTSHCALPP
eukprot:gene10566-12221_t